MNGNRLPGRLAAAILIGGVAGSAAAADLMPGPYLKTYAAYSESDITFRTDDGASRDFAPDGGAFGAALGYLAPLGQGAFGVELFYGADDARSSDPLVAGQSEASSARRIFQGDHSFGASARLGGFVARKILVYAIGGWQWYRLENTVIDAEGGRTTRGRTYNGPRAGVGAALPLFSHRLSLRLEATRSFLDDREGVDPEQDLYSLGLAWSF